MITSVHLHESPLIQSIFVVVVGKKDLQCRKYYVKYDVLVAFSL